MGLDQILRHCVLQHERNDVLWECHTGVIGGHVGGKATTRNILHVGYSGRLSIKIIKELPGNATTTKGLGSLRDAMSYLYI